jgi:hypothetical protein
MEFDAVYYGFSWLAREKGIGILGGYAFILNPDMTVNKKYEEFTDDEKLFSDFVVMLHEKLDGIKNFVNETSHVDVD